MKLPVLLDGSKFRLRILCGASPCTPITNSEQPIMAAFFIEAGSPPIMTREHVAERLRDRGMVARVSGFRKAKI